MTYSYKEKVQHIQMLTEKQLTYIVKIWLRTFGEEICGENLDQLYGHSKDFYDGIISESLEKEEKITDEIKSLRREVEHISWLLNVRNPVLDHSIGGDEPQLLIKTDLENYLAELNECLHQRKNEIEHLLTEQARLCEELGAEERSLLMEPLPTEEDIQEFKHNLDKLRQERQDRLEILSTLRDEIKKFLFSLEVEEETEDSILKDDQLKLTNDTLSILQKKHAFYSKQVQYKRIYDLYKERLMLCERMAALQVKATDPSRYINRGGQLLKDEKERKMIVTALPKIEQKLNELLICYEQQENKPFMLNGENIRDVMAKDWPKNNEKIENRSNISVTPSRIKTPSSTKELSTPLSLKCKINVSDKSTQKMKRSISYNGLGVRPNVFFKSTNSPCGKSFLKSPLIASNQSKIAKKSPLSCSSSKSKGNAASVTDYTYLNHFVAGIKATSRSTLLPKLDRRDSLQF